ncbi:sulfotransferase [Thalassoporum mexicanum PCC 7367]|uniref:tetratricopeptide repeat-containing sulfotransferase family protein n=1 Tax=Thalassoporum mexicanum TaxID=3457544 RepID=UPI00029F8965|nr:tetratricopeptide repeat-containing sulfotransferase family protein [Pseudanabaena sp. PCC 7367]AFY68820.1 sulfotransferase [Pseudanabaena sp. PCC 7367]
MTSIAATFAQALQLHQAGQLQQADVLYRQVLTEQPNHADALHLRGVIAHQVQKHELALKYINMAIAANGNNPVFYNNLGEVQTALGQYDHALASYEQALAIRPKMAEAYLGLGNVHKLQGDLAKAIDNYQKAIAVNPNYEQAYTEMALVQIQQYDAPAAVAASNQALQLNPNSAPAYRALAKAYLLQDRTEEAIAQYEQAIAQYEQAIAKDPELAEAHWELSVALNAKLSLHQLKAIQLNPTLIDYQSQLQLAKSLSKQGKTNEAISCLENIIEIKPDCVPAHINLGITFSEILDRQTDAIAHLRKAIELSPRNAEAYSYLATAIGKQGDVGTAMQYAKQALQLNPNLAEAHQIEAEAYGAMRELDKALESCKRALALRPNFAEALNTCGNIYMMGGNTAEAIKFFEQAVAAKPNFLKAQYSLGSALQTSGDFERALAVYDRVLRIYPDNPEAIAGKAGILERQKQYQAAYDLIKPLFEAYPENYSFLITYATVCRRLKKTHEALPSLKARLEKTQIGPGQKQHLLFTLGDLYDSINEYDAAFDAYQQANSQYTDKYDRHQSKLDFGSLSNAYDRENLAKLPRAQNNSEVPVFIVGMPRSGTTLVEQIVASHPAVYGAGELTDVAMLLHKTIQRFGLSRPYPDLIDYFNQGLVDEMAQQHLDRLRQFSATAERITDKMPYNFMHLGLIAILFPKARIFHCTRDPLDNGVSYYFQNFIGSHPQKHDLGNIGYYYQLYRRLMEHWQATLDLPIMEIKYEEVVANQEAMSRQMIEFLGLEWDDACLSFYESKRFARTVSYDQVRQPIYNKSVGRYKNYEKYLDPLKAALAEEI